jgi:hypothetical protein
MLTRRMQQHFQACLRAKAARAKHACSMVRACAALRQRSRIIGLVGREHVGVGDCVPGAGIAKLWWTIANPAGAHPRHACTLCTTLGIISWKHIKCRGRLLTAGVVHNPHRMEG